jgi:hypothetical protein
MSAKEEKSSDGSKNSQSPKLKCESDEISLKINSEKLSENMSDDENMSEFDSEDDNSEEDINHSSGNGE